MFEDIQRSGSVIALNFENVNRKNAFRELQCSDLFANQMSIVFLKIEPLCFRTFRVGERKLDKYHTETFP